MAVLRALRRLVAATFIGLRRGLSWAFHRIVTTGHRLVSVIVKARRRLSQRWGEDLSFRRTILASWAPSSRPCCPTPLLPPP